MDYEQCKTARLRIGVKNNGAERKLMKNSYYLRN